MLLQAMMTKTGMKCIIKHCEKRFHPMKQNSLHRFDDVGFHLVSIDSSDGAITRRNS